MQRRECRSSCRGENAVVQRRECCGAERRMLCSLPCPQRSCLLIWVIAEGIWIVAEGILIIAEELGPCGGNLDHCGGDLDPCGGNLDHCGWDLDPCGGNLNHCGGDLDPCGGSLALIVGNSGHKGTASHPWQLDSWLFQLRDSSTTLCADNFLRRQLSARTSRSTGVGGFDQATRNLYIESDCYCCVWHHNRVFWCVYHRNCVFCCFQHRK